MQFLKDYRVEHNLTQKQMAELLGTSRNYYCSLETGKKKPGFRLFGKIAEVLGIPVEYLRRMTNGNYK
jgi:transcriptional regulator with XRE-family HTH domain